LGHLEYRCPAASFGEALDHFAVASRWNGKGAIDA